MPAGDVESVELSGECLASADCVVIATDHSCYNIGEVARLLSGFIQYLLSKDKHPKNPTNSSNSTNSISD